MEVVYLKSQTHNSIIYYTYKSTLSVKWVKLEMSWLLRGGGGGEGSGVRGNRPRASARDGGGGGGGGMSWGWGGSGQGQGGGGCHGGGVGWGVWITFPRVSDQVLTLETATACMLKPGVYRQLAEEMVPIMPSRFPVMISPWRNT